METDNKTQAPNSESLAQGLREQIRTYFVDRLSADLGQMFADADDVLFDMANAASNNSEQQGYLDSLRVVRMRKEAISRAFKNLLGRRFDGDFEPTPRVGPNAGRFDAGDTVSVNFDELELQNTESAERELAIKNMVQKAEAHSQMAMWELKRRLSWMRNNDLLDLPVESIDARAICGVFRAAMDELDGVELKISLIVYKLFERVVAGNLDQFYRGLNAALAEMGIETDDVAVRSAAPGPQSAATPAGADAAAISGAAQVDSVEAPAPMTAQPAPAGPAPQAHAAGGAMAAHGQAPASAATPTATAAQVDVDKLPPLQVSSRTQSVMQQLLSVQQSQADAGARPGAAVEADLLRRLLQASKGQPVEGWSPVRAYTSAQRTEAVGRMFNTLADDDSLPAEMRPQIDRFRLQATKAALRDADFIRNAEHPMRALVNELSDLAATAHFARGDAADRISRFITEMQHTAEEPVPQTDADWDETVLEQDELDAFLEEQLERTRARRDEVERKAHLLATEELKLRVIGHDIRDDGIDMLEAGWIPTVADVLLRSGAESDAYKRGLNLLDRLIYALDRSCGSLVTPERAEETLGQFIQEMQWANMPADEIEIIDTGMQKELARVREISETLSEFAGLTALEKASAGAEEADAEAPAAPVVDRATTEAQLAPLKEDVVHVLPPQGEGEDGLVELTAEALSLLDEIVQPGTWFELHDPAIDRARWMRAVAHYPSKQNSGFCDYNYKNNMIVDDNQFILDLVAGRTMPVDPTPRVREAIRSLVEPLKVAAVA